jgi:hypothetical protein
VKHTVRKHASNAREDLNRDSADLARSIEDVVESALSNTMVVGLDDEGAAASLQADLSPFGGNGSF